MFLHFFCVLCPCIDVCTSGVIVPSLCRRFYWKRVDCLEGMQENAWIFALPLSLDQPRSVSSGGIFFFMLSYQWWDVVTSSYHVLSR